MNYLDKLDKKILEYFKMLEPDFPLWLIDYINTDALLKQQYISVTCGTIYSDLFPSKFFFSSLDHSISVALICWHFTHDKKITLSGLFHDIATPVFKHSIDFFNGDYINQESTEDLTTEIIKNSKQIMDLLNRDNIKLEEVSDYHIYPIADNDTPKLSSDRLEYTLSNALLTYELAELDQIKEIYQDIEIESNEDGIIELGFKTKKIAREFVRIMSNLSIIYMEHKTRYSMQFLADIIKKLSEENLIALDDLYNKKELEIIEIIENSKYKEVFNIWKKAKKVKVAEEKPLGLYYVNHGAKIRYIDPLVRGQRISSICKIANKNINKALFYDMNKYVYLDFNF